jgi:hypothetical protein
MSLVMAAAAYLAKLSADQRRSAFGKEDWSAGAPEAGCTGGMGASREL